MRRRMGTALFVVGVGMALVLALGGAPPQAVGAASTVVTNCQDSGTGSLRGTIVAATAGATLTFAVDCPSGSPILLASTLIMSRAVTIDATGHTIVVDGQHNTTVFQVNSGVRATLIALTIQNGTANSGGGINNSGTLTVMTSTFSGNSASSGLGITLGGGIDNYGGTLTVMTSTFSGNSASNDGGGIANYGGTLTVTNSTFSGNSASDGGGIYNDSSTATVTNSTFSGNSASADGGGIENNGTLTVTNSTLSGNSASFVGGGIESSGTLPAKNNLIVNSTGGDCNGCGTLGPTNITGAFTFASPLQDNGGPTPTFAISTSDAAYHTGDLATCQGLHSTAVDGSDLTGASAVDQRGAPRIGSNLCSIGAFEPGLVRSLTHLSARAGGTPVAGGGSVPYGTSLTLTATSTGIVGGILASGSDTYTFKDGGTTIAGCSGVARTGSTATCTPGTLVGGGHTFRVNGFPGDSVYLASATPNTLIVNVTPIACVVTSTQDPSESGKLTLRDAVNLANANACTMNQITFDPVTNGQTIVLNNAFLFVTQSVTVTGNGVTQTMIQPSSGVVPAFTITDGSFTLSQLTFHGGGGAIVWQSSSGSDTLTVSDTVFDGVFDGLADTGIGTIHVARTLFRAASNIGIIAFGGSTITVTNSTFSGNSVALDISHPGIAMTVTNSTFAGNAYAFYGSAQSPMVSHSIVAASSSANCQGTLTDGGFNFADDASCAFSQATSHNSTPPLLDATLRGNGTTNGIPTLALLPGSPAIDASSSACPSGVTVDARNLMRSDGRCDSGSFESQGFTFSMQTGSPQSTTKNTAFPTPLGLTVISSHNEPVVGGQVTFTGPVMNASITPNPTLATITGTAGATSGAVSRSVTANSMSGPFTVTASAVGVPTSGVGGNLAYALTIDTRVVDISGTTPLAPLTNASSVTYTVTFADPVGGLTTGDFVATAPSGSGVTGASVTNIAAMGTAPTPTWMVTVSTGTGDGDLRLDFTSAASDAVPPVANAPFTKGQVYTIDKTPPTLSTLPAPLPAAIVGQAYSASFVASDAHTPVITGALGVPSGFTFTPGTGALANTATLTGTPTSAGMIMFTVQAQDAARNSVSQPYTITVQMAMVTGLSVSAPTGSGSGNHGTASMPVLTPGSSLTLAVTGSYNNGMMGSVSGLTYQSSDPTKVTVDANGKITALASGVVTITVTAPNGVMTTITITVTTVTGGGLMNPNAQPMTHATVAAPLTATPQPQPGSHPPSGGGNGSGGVQPQAAGAAPTATPAPLPQPGRH